MQKGPDLLFVMVLIFGLGVLFTGVTVSQARQATLPSSGQMPGVIISSSSSMRSRP